VTNELQIFENPEFGKVRAVERDGEPWFVAADVCRALEIGNPTQALTRLDDDEKSNTLISNEGNRGNPNVAIINEPGLYSLVLGSRKPEAKAFKRWVVHEVIPSIRKHGMYATENTLEAMLNDPDTMIRLLQNIKEERVRRKALEAENAAQRQVIAEFTPKVSYYDIVLQTKDVLSIGKIAKDYGKSAQWMNQQLHSRGIQYKQGGIWLLYQKYADQGYTKSKTEVYRASNGEEHSKLHTYWTQKGRLFIYDQLKSDGILPLVEQTA